MGRPSRDDARGKPLLKCGMSPGWVGADRMTGSMAITGYMGRTAKWVAVVPRAQKTRATGAGDVEPSLSQYNLGGQDISFHTPTIWQAIRGRDLSRLPFMRRGCGSCAWSPQMGVYRLYCGIPVVGTGSLFSTQFRSLTCSRDQGAARPPPRRLPCGWRPKYRYRVAPRKAGSRQGAAGNAWVRVWRRPRPGSVQPGLVVRRSFYYHPGVTGDDNPPSENGLSRRRAVRNPTAGPLTCRCPKLLGIGARVSAKMEGRDEPNQQVPSW